METYLVTGGAGFIGSNFILHSLACNEVKIINLDKLTYAGNLENLRAVEDNSHYKFIEGNINDKPLVEEILKTYAPDKVINFAAESHVDRSILEPKVFLDTNVFGVFNLLERAKEYWEILSSTKKCDFRFLHVSTDEVYGSLDSQESAFTEDTPYKPNSPYAASKAASDFFVRAYFKTYGLPTLITNCSNNFGPYQFPEKLIPLTIVNALEGKSIPIYGNGLNIRDWIFVTDHCEALELILKEGEIGERYNIGASNEKTNIEVIQAICRILDREFPSSPNFPHSSLIQYVKDRSGHDQRYAINSKKISTILNWFPKTTFQEGLEKTIYWYINNQEWIGTVKTKHQQWLKVRYS